MTTLHANSARDAFARLELMLAMGGLDMPVRVIREYVASAIHLVVHLARLPDGRRVMSEAVEVTGADADGVRLRAIHRFDPQAGAASAHGGAYVASGEQPAFLARLSSRGVNVDPRLFEPGPLARVPGP